MKGLLSLGTVALVVAACGGGGGDHYSRDATATCLREAGADVSTSGEDLDLVAAEAGEGGLHATLDETSVTIAFERTEADAKRTMSVYRSFGDAFGMPFEDILKREGNAVALWDASPTDEQKSTVDDCLTA